MPRPSKPLISREATVTSALKVIDTEGIEALSLPRLAREMNVRAPSLYHHFTDKNEILAAVSREVVRKTVFPRKSSTGDWVEWFTQLTLNFRTAVLRHRNAAPLLVQFMPRALMADMYERATAYLVECDVPTALHVQILDGLEKFALGATVTEATRPARQTRIEYPFTSPETHPALTAALEANSLSPTEVFEHSVRCYLLGISRVGLP
jgi:TetR/AcrR family tetracycline transcriptional repressor